MPSGPRDAPDARAELGRAQAVLVRALVAGGAPPPGFDPGRLAAASSALVDKRAREVAKAWPALARALGPRLAETMRARAAAHPPPASGGAVVDGLALLTRRARRGLPVEARVEHLARRAEFTVRRGRLRRRRLFAGAVLLRRPRRLLLALRIPGLGLRWVRVGASRGRSAYRVNHNRSNKAAFTERGTDFAEE